MGNTANENVATGTGWINNVFISQKSRFKSYRMADHVELFIVFAATSILPMISICKTCVALLFSTEYTNVLYHWNKVLNLVFAETQARVCYLEGR